MKIGKEIIKNNEKIILQNEVKNKQEIIKNNEVGFEFFSHTLGKKFNVDYEVEMVTFEDGVTYSFDEIQKMKQNFSALDVCNGHLLKRIFGVTFVGEERLELEKK
jgi:hypothetical protein